MVRRGDSPIQPIYIFDDVNEFEARHRLGTEVEFNNEASDIEGFNGQGSQFSAWVVAQLSKSNKRASWLFLVAPGGMAEGRLPKEGETCHVKLLSKSGKTEKSDWLEACRIGNPAASLGLPEEEHQRYCAFKVYTPGGFGLKPMHKDPEDEEDANVQQKSLRLTGKKAIKIIFWLSISTTTMEAELAALDTLVHDKRETRTARQEAAFKYLMDFKKPTFTVNLFYHFPHLKDPLNNPHGLSQRVISLLHGFNEHQRLAYRHLLSNLPCGICIIPGGPGAGKTHWNLVLTCTMQSKNSVVYGPDSTSLKSAKVLYLLDINKPLDDTANKMMRLYQELGLRKKAVRLYSWHYGKKDQNPRFLDKFMLMARMERFNRDNPSRTSNCMAPTLDEAVWEHYEQHKATKYRDLAYNLAAVLQHGKEAIHEDFKGLITDLYADTLDTIDFIATTPVPAASGLGGLFKPDLIIFDESPHARELSTLIAIANYEPLAWIFSGDHRQTRPFVASDDPRDNPYAPQMLVSTMERAHRAGATKCSLLINHRAFAGLERLASGLFYNNAMITGHEENNLFPPTVRYLQTYLERFMDGGKCLEPRLIVCTDYSRERQQGTSWYNEGHLTWVMARAVELLQDPQFKRVDKPGRGTILIIAPYREAFIRYQKAIKQLTPANQQRFHVESRLEARTIDTVQGNEADVVFLDFVRHQGTEFTDHPNRLCVALTRARQAEIIMMNPGMCTKGGSSMPTVNLTRIWNHSARLGQIVRIRQGEALSVNGVVQKWTPRILPLPAGTPDITHKALVRVSQTEATSTSVEPTRVARAQQQQTDVILTKPARSTNVSKVQQQKAEIALTGSIGSIEVSQIYKHSADVALSESTDFTQTTQVQQNFPVAVDSTQTNGADTIPNSDAAVKPLQSKTVGNIPVDMAAKAPVEQMTEPDNFWGDDEVCRFLYELTRTVPESSLLEKAKASSSLDEPTHTAQKPQPLKEDVPRLDETDRATAPVNHRQEVPAEPECVATSTEEEALPCGSDWW